MQSQKWNDNRALGEFAKSRLYYPFADMRIAYILHMFYIYANI